jgi:hypothetical protein
MLRANEVLADVAQFQKEQGAAETSSGAYSSR